MTTRRMHPETMVLHAAYRQDEATGAVAVPIYQTTSYQFRGTQHAENLFALKELGNIYSRIMNPTCDVLERRFAAIEGGAAGLAVGSGQAASTFAVMNLCQSGDNFVSSTDLYGGTWNLFANTLKSMGVEVRFVDPADPQAFARATDAPRHQPIAGSYATCIPAGTCSRPPGRARPSPWHTRARRSRTMRRPGPTSRR